MAKGLQWFYTKSRRFVQNLDLDEVSHCLRAEVEDALHVLANQGQFFGASHHAEVKPGRSDLLEIFRLGKKFKDLFDRAGNPLLAFECVSVHFLAARS